MSAPAAPGNLERLLLWLLGNVLLTAAVAWVAFQLQQEQFAPAVVFPLLVGAALGAGGWAIRHFTRAPRRRIAIAAALVWGLLVVVGQDYIGHRHRLRQFDIEMGSQSPSSSVTSGPTDTMRPRFSEYLAGVVRRQPLWWSLELALTAGAAVAVTAWGTTKED